MKRSRKHMCLLLTLVMLAGFCMPGFALETYANDNSSTMSAARDVSSVSAAFEVPSVIDRTEQYLLNTVKEPGVSSIGGEWSVIGIARASGLRKVNDKDSYEAYFEGYYETLCDTLKEADGVLHARKYTEYSRVILALSAIGKNPEKVNGYNLLEKLSDFDKLSWQGVNGPVWALIALDSKDYDVPCAKEGAVQTTRELLVKSIVKNELAGGGFALAGDEAEIDLTAMAICALAPYSADKEVAGVIDRSLKLLSDRQNGDGGYTNYGEATAETCAQVVTMLCTLGINPGTDERFIKNGNSVLDNLLSYRLNDGSFEHIKGDGSNLMATEQAFYALVSYCRYVIRVSPLYDMKDSAPFSGIVNVYIDRKTVPFDETYGYPFVDANGRTQVPLRITMEAYGCTVNWNGKDKGAELSLGDTTVYVPIGNREITYSVKSGNCVTLDTVINDTEAVIIDGRTYVPIRAVVEIFGGSVSWNEAGRSVIIEK